VKIARDRIAGLDSYEKDLARRNRSISLIGRMCCGAPESLRIEELKSLFADGRLQRDRECAGCPGRPRLVAPAGGLDWRRNPSGDDAARFDPPPLERLSLRRFKRALMARAGIRSKAYDCAR